MPATAIMINARLQAAAERAWRNNRYLHVNDAWRDGRHHTLPLYEFQPSIQVRAEPRAMETLTVPYLLLRSEPMLTSVRIIVTAPVVSNDWFWIAARFHWRNGIEFNYTN